uniref:Uncharacterized protein n=1 Tax=Cacopsylla melanoneura TaxID=428564 RepID=A0A8D8VAP1_9HEMI
MGQRVVPALALLIYMLREERIVSNYTDQRLYLGAQMRQLPQPTIRSHRTSDSSPVRVIQPLIPGVEIKPVESYQGSSLESLDNRGPDAKTETSLCYFTNQATSPEPKAYGQVHVRSQMESKLRKHRHLHGRLHTWRLARDSGNIGSLAWPPSLTLPTLKRVISPSPKGTSPQPAPIPLHSWTLPPTEGRSRRVHPPMPKT